MKLMLFAVIVMFKCSRLSSAPADSSSSEGSNKNNSENELALNQPPGFSSIAHSPSLSYVSDVDNMGTSGVVFQFRRSIKSDNTEIEARRRSALDKGFMRFGRAGNMMRFGRSPADNDYDSEPTMPKMRKNDKNILRFGRAGNLIRFGRNFVDDETDDYNDASEIDEFSKRPVLRSPNNRYDEHGNKILRLGRSSSESVSNEDFDAPEELQPSVERSDESSNNKKSADKNILRFGRGNMMRFGRANPMRFGKRANMMRFGRNEQPRNFYKAPKMYQNRAIRANNNDRNLIRLGRAGNLIRFGRNEKNLLRFGKRSGPQAMSSSTKIYCEDDDCVIQENQNQLLENAQNQIVKSDQLKELFGNDEPSKQGYGEYIIERK